MRFEGETSCGRAWKLIKKGVLVMRFIVWVIENFGWIGGIGFLAVVLGIICLAAGGGGIGVVFLIPGIVVIVLAKKFVWP